MSEEKPTFKITDRRLFNADGTPREDAVREEETPAPAPAPQEPASQPADEPPHATAQTSAARSASEPQATTHVPEAGAGAAEDDDPQEFLMVVEFIASFAAEALGMTERPPAGGQPVVNLPLAKQCIDMLGTLERKTRGNLSAEEQHYFELILSQLRMQYVSLTGAQRSPARGFTGGDITGGR